MKNLTRVFVAECRPSKNKRANLKRIFFAIAIIFLAITVIIHPEFASDGIRKGISCSVNILIPSMFFLVFISVATTQCGISEKAKKHLEKVTEFLFYLPGSTAPIIFLSLFGGYPVGAVGTAKLYDKNEITEEQLNRMMLFCVNSGPAFIVSALGKTLLGSVRTGSWLFLVQIISSIFIGILSGILARIKKIKFYSKTIALKEVDFNFGTVFVDSCKGACLVLANICAPVILFFGITSILENSGLINCFSVILKNFGISSQISKVLFISLIEMTQGCIVAANAGAPLWMFSWILGFGGLCAHTQILASLKGRSFNYLKFAAFRIVNGIITALITAHIIQWL